MTRPILAALTCLRTASNFVAARQGSSAVEQGTHKPLVGSSILPSGIAPATEVKRNNLPAARNQCNAVRDPKNPAPMMAMSPRGNRDSVTSILNHPCGKGYLACK